MTLPEIHGLGTLWWIELFSVSEARAQELHALLSARIHAFDAHYSRFSKTSYVGRLNARETITDPPPELLTLLDIGLTWHTRSNGLFHFLTAEHQAARGYDASYSFSASESIPAIIDPHNVLHMSEREVRLTDSAIDFGGYGKGFLIDTLASLLRSHEVTSFIINGGGDIYASDPSGNGHRCVLEHSTEAGTYIGEVTLSNAALAVSSSYKRQWKHAVSGERINHFIDPIDPTRSVQAASYVIAPTTLQADIAATLCCLRPELQTVRDLQEDITDVLIMPENKAPIATPGFRNHLFTTPQET